MLKAFVNGVECTVYNYTRTDTGLVCEVLYPNYTRKFPVLAELIELREVLVND